MDKLANRVKNLKPSATLAISSKAKAMMSEGIDVVNLSAGEPDFDTPQHIKNAASEAMRDGFTKYTAVGGIDGLKDAIIEKYSRDCGVTYQRSEIIVTCGGKHAVYNLAQALFEEGDEVIIPSPYWVSYPPIISLADATPVILKTTEDTGFKLSIDELLNAINPKTRALIINSPSNPNGAVYSKSDLEAIANIALEKEIILITDEIYDYFVYDGIKSVSLASFGEAVKERTVIINGVSKAYSMTGWRIGYACGPEDVISAMTRIQSQSTSNPTSIAQKASIAAIKGPQTELEMMVREFDKRRNRIVDLLNQIEGMTCFVPGGAFYVFPNVSGFFNKSYNGKKFSSASDIAAYLLEEAKVAVVPGEAFGSNEHVRISYACSMEDIEKGLERIGTALGRLE
ncbi:MAG: pyridoxal phosphate-dependent aminotransferase [Thermodesulfobacteriota bacterium]